jgi:hypothetical protein
MNVSEKSTASIFSIKKEMGQATSACCVLVDFSAYSLTLMMDAVRSNKTPTNFYETTRRIIRIIA